MCVCVCLWDTEGNPQCHESKLAADRPDSFWVIGPRWARKTGRIFPPDKRRRVLPGPANTYAHMHSPLSSQACIARIRLLDKCHRYARAKRGRQTACPGRWQLLGPAEWSGSRSATRAKISVSAGCVLAVRGPLG